MTDDNVWESAMSRDFDARVRDLHESPLDLADVKGAARTIRRRRRTAVAGAALAAAAVVVPTALLAGLPGGSGAGPAPAEDPTVTDEVHASYLAGGVWHRADGEEVDLPRDNYYGAVMWDDRLVALRSLGDQGRTAADIIDTQGTVMDSFETVGGVAVNEAGTTLAWVDTDRRIMTRWEPGEDDRRGGLLPLSEPGVSNWVLAVTGGPDCRASADGCRVLTERAGYSSGGVVQSPAPGDAIINDAASGLLTVTDEVTDDSSCGGVYDEAAGSLRFRSCDHTYDEIAPGGAYVVGLPSYLDGIGPGRAAILDAEDGTELARYDDATVIETAWVDESRLLIDAYDYDEQVWRLVMLDADGTVTEVADPVPGQDLDNAFVPIGR